MEEKEYEGNQIFQEEIDLDKEINLNETEQLHKDDEEDSASYTGYQSVLEDIDEHEEEDIEENTIGDAAAQKISLKKDYADEINDTHELINVIDIKQEQEKTNATSFKAYVDKEKTKSRNPLVKWLVRLFKFIVACMLLPITAIIGLGCISVVGGYIAGTIGIFAGGVFSLVAGAFFATQMTGEMMALCIAVGITALSGSALLALLFIMFFRWVFSSIRNLRDKEGNR